jgi:hypothetical protein
MTDPHHSTDASNFTAGLPLPPVRPPWTAQRRAFSCGGC